MCAVYRPPQGRFHPLWAWGETDYFPAYAIREWVSPIALACPVLQGCPIRSRHVQWAFDETEIQYLVDHSFPERILRTRLAILLHWWVEVSFLHVATLYHRGRIMAEHPGYFLWNGQVCRNNREDFMVLRRLRGEEAMTLALASWRDRMAGLPEDLRESYAQRGFDEVHFTLPGYVDGRSPAAAFLALCRIMPTGEGGSPHPVESILAPLRPEVEAMADQGMWQPDPSLPRLPYANTTDVDYPDVYQSDFPPSFEWMTWDIDYRPLGLANPRMVTQPVPSPRSPGA